MSMSSNPPRCTMISAGCARYGRRDGLSSRELFSEALDELFSNCPKLSRQSVGALYLGQAFETFEHQANTPAGIANNYGLVGIPTMRVDSVSSSGGSALRTGYIAVASGEADVVLCGGVEKMTCFDTPKALEVISMAADRPFEQWNGATLTALNALAAGEHMRRFGTIEERLALVSVKNHENALENPKAYLRRRVTTEEVLSSRKVSTPLKLLDCSPICDGASCVALCRPDLAAKFTDTPIDMIASGEASDCDFIFREDLTGFSSTRLATRKAFSQAGIGVRDIDFAELHDAFTINEIIAYEDIGLCSKGAGGKLIESGETRIEGSIPVNPSGGLKAKGHPVGSSGIGQAYEVFVQFTERAASGRSVRSSKLALTHSMGGAGVTAQVHIFKARA